MQKLAASELHEGGLVLADYQTQGRGQRHATWESTSGMNLTFTIALFPDLPVHLQFYLNIMTALAITDCLGQQLNDALKIKWPNDIYYGQFKICGILIQNNLKLNKIQSCAVGIGLNVNQTSFVPESAASLKTITGRDWNREALLRQLAESLEKRYFELKEQHFAYPKEAYLDMLYWKDERHMFRDDQGEFQGVVVGIDNEGRLLIDRGSRLQSYSLKEVTFLR